MEKLEFTELVRFLRKHGYSIDIQVYGNSYKAAMVTGNNIRAGFCTPSRQVYTYINNRIAVDHVACFDKWSKCPLIMELPVDGEELLKHLKYLGSEEGYKISNEFLYCDGNNPWPYEIPDDVRIWNLGA
jgi:hypothetical protein